MVELRIGTCSWKYPSWEGLVYSQAQGINYLFEYAQKYNTVEIDQWFWSLHSPGSLSLPEDNTVAEYVSSVPESFKFTVKTPNSITLTHYYKGKKSDPLTRNPHFLSPNLLDTFLEKIEPMKRYLGALMFQFEYLNKQKVSSQKEFLDKLHEFFSRAPSGYPYAIETRNPQYLNTEYFGFLKEHNLSHVFLQGYYMPYILKIYYNCRSYILDHEMVVIRLHGPNRQKIEKKASGSWSKIIEPKDEELAGVASMIKEIQSGGTNVYLNVNNHYEGSAPLTIGRIQNLLS